MATVMLLDFLGWVLRGDTGHSLCLGELTKDPVTTLRASQAATCSGLSPIRAPLTTTHGTQQDFRGSSSASEPPADARWYRDPVGK